LTKVPVGVFAWSTFSEECKRPDSSTQVEVFMFELRGKSVSMVPSQLEAENGNSD